MNWKNELTRKLAIEYPIIQAPMFGVTTPDMVAAASNINCIGSLSLADLNTEKCIQAIRATKKLTNKPFIVNFFAHSNPEITDTLRSKYNQAKAFIEQLANEHNMHLEISDIDDLQISSYQEPIEAILAEECKLVSFTFGNIDQQNIEILKSKGTILIGTCTSVEEAIILENAGIDIICVQGLEAGGHRGSFNSEEIPKIGGLSLLAQVSDTIHLPIIYAGGIYNAKTLLAAKTLGAQGFQIGSLLLGSKESALKEFEKERLRKVKEDEIVLTKSFSGRYARGIKNKFISSLEDSKFILPYPYQNKLTAEIRRMAKEHQNTEFLNIWLGQSICNYNEGSTSDILRTLIIDTENIRI